MSESVIYLFFGRFCHHMTSQVLRTFAGGRWCNSCRSGLVVSGYEAELRYIGREVDTVDITLGDSGLEQTERFVYLHVTVSADHTTHSLGRLQPSPSTDHPIASIFHTRPQLLDALKSGILFQGVQEGSSLSPSSSIPMPHTSEQQMQTAAVTRQEGSSLSPSSSIPMR